MFHRAAWLVRDTQRHRPQPAVEARSARRSLDPMTGVNRFMSGDASRVVGEAGRHGAVGPGRLRVGRRAVARHAAERAQLRAASPSSRWTCSTATPRPGRSRTPYDAFAVRLRFGGGAISEARVRGRLLGEPFGNGRWQLNVAQTYNFQSNRPTTSGRSRSRAAWPTVLHHPPPARRLQRLGRADGAGAVDSIGAPGKEPSTPTIPFRVSPSTTVRTTTAPDHSSEGRRCSRAMAGYSP